MAEDGTSAARTAGAGNLAWGGFLLLSGDLLWRDLTGRAPSSTEQRVIQVLGVRHAAQGLAQVVAPGSLRRLWRAVDLGHAASMLPLVALDPRRRRPAVITAVASLLSALVAPSAAAVTGRRAAPPAPVTPPPPPAARRARR